MGGNIQWARYDWPTLKILRAVDGGDWNTAVHEIGCSALKAVAYGDGLFVAVGNQRILTSVDGTVWAERPCNTPLLADVAFGDGRFVAVGGGTLIQSSTRPDQTLRFVPQGCRFTKDGAFEVTIAGPPGQDITLDVSADLLQWVAWSTEPNPTGTARYRLPLAQPWVHGYCRLSGSQRRDP